MPRFATETTVPVERTRSEIEEMLIRYGANEFHSGWMDGQSVIAFRLKDLFIRFILPIPAKSESRFQWKVVRKARKRLTQLQSERAWDQEVKSRWRALRLVVQAKLEAVECGISTLENEFMAFIVLSDGTSFGEWVVDTALPAIRGGKMPPMLGAKREEVQDAEIVN